MGNYPHGIMNQVFLDEIVDLSLVNPYFYLEGEEKNIQSFIDEIQKKYPLIIEEDSYDYTLSSSGVWEIFFLKFIILLLIGTVVINYFFFLHQRKYWLVLQFDGFSKF